MEYTVKALADLAGVTPRTLRWYDQTGLLKPLRTTEAGYRLYGPKQLDRLQDILFYRELGVKVSDRLRSIYRDIIKTEKSVETDLDIIKNDLREATSVEGAFFCEYEIFKDVYRLQARSIARNGQTVYIGLLTVTDFNSGIPDSKLLNNAMDHLEGAIRLSLRKGDVAARFSAAQYVVLLPTVTFESGSKVLERIVNRFSREHRNIPVIIHTKLQPLDPIPL